MERSRFAQCRFPTDVTYAYDRELTMGLPKKGMELHNAWP